VSVVGDAVDPRPDEVAVAVVARVLLEPLQVNPGDASVRRVGAEPPALHVGHVPHQAKKGQAGRGIACSFDWPAVRSAHLCSSVVVEVQSGSQRGALIQDEPRLGALHPRSRPCFVIDRHGHESSDCALASALNMGDLCP
jgi:hypothetical protein